MENKDIKNNAAELNDKMLEKVSGGLLVPVISDPGSKSKCVICGNKDSVKINGEYYCDKCRP